MDSNGRRLFAIKRDHLLLIEALVPTDRLTVLQKIIDQALVPVFYHPDIGLCRDVIAACASAGARAVEFTNRGPYAADVFRALSQHFATADRDVILGAGSIVDAATAALYIANGAEFVVGPTLNADVARLCNRRKIAYSPGCSTASEISNAEELGCELVKLFPAAALGPDFVKAILGPMPWTRIMATGIGEASPDNLTKWFKAGVSCVGLGSNLITHDILERRDFAALETKVRETLSVIRQIRSH